MTKSRTREQRLRRAAQRQDFKLVKNPRRDPRAVDYGGYNLRDQNGANVFADWVELDQLEREVYYALSKD